MKGEMMNKKIFSRIIFTILVIIFIIPTSYAASDYEIVTNFNFSLSANPLTMSLTKAYTGSRNYETVRVIINSTSGGDNYDIGMTTAIEELVVQKSGLSKGRKYVIDFKPKNIEVCRPDADYTVVCDSTKATSSGDYCLLQGMGMKIRLKNYSLLGGKITVNGTVKFLN